MNNILVVAPHPDDETIGAGGSLLRHVEEGDSVSWLVVTAMTSEYSDERIGARRREIDAVARGFGFSDYHCLGFPTARLDTIARADIVSAVGRYVAARMPHTMYVPFPGDAHSDHAVVFNAIAATTKWFRYPSVRRVLAYETLSETDFGMDPTAQPFRPTVFVDITAHLEKKVTILNTYAGEIGKFPFPRSTDAVRSLAKVRGTAAGFEAAEAFVLLRERL